MRKLNTWIQLLLTSDHRGKPFTPQLLQIGNATHILVKSLAAMRHVGQW